MVLCKRRTDASRIEGFRVPVLDKPLEAVEALEALEGRLMLILVELAFVSGC